MNEKPSYEDVKKPDNNGTQITRILPVQWPSSINESNQWTLPGLIFLF